MRGLIFGAGYGSAFIFIIIGYGIYWPFTHLSINCGPGVISCEFWYLLLALLITTIFSGLLLIVGKWYKNRKREDVLPNQHIFAERYYMHNCNDFPYSLTIQFRFHFLPTPYTIICQFTITHTRQVKDKYFIQLHYFVIDRGINHLTNHALL